jgi:phage terminase large subunit-like protein
MVLAHVGSAGAACARGQLANLAHPRRTRFWEDRGGRAMGSSPDRRRSPDHRSSRGDAEGLGRGHGRAAHSHQPARPDAESALSPGAGDVAQRLRGPEFDTAWVDEFAKYRYARETWDMLQFTMRSGSDPRVLITTTPRPIPVLKEIMAAKDTVLTRGSTMENAGNLAPSFMQSIIDRYAGTRLGRQELEAEMLDDVPGALWTRAMFDTCRIKQAPEMRRVVIAVDPSGTAGEGDGGRAGDDVGIVAAGVGIDGRGYVLGDYSCNLSPEGWARRAVAAYWQHDADRIVAERNFGGAMVEAVLRSVDKNIPVTLVTASRGKIARAEPVAALYEQGKISHVGAFPELEDQHCAMTPAGFMGEGSPDRADANVWALSELMLGQPRGVTVTKR